METEKTAVTTVAIQVQEQELALRERSFELSQRELKPFISTAMIPAHLRDLGSLMILDIVRKKYNMDLLFLAQEMYVVKGKFAISGKLAIALINKSGFLDGRLKFEVRSQPFGVRAYGMIDGEAQHGMWIDDALIKANGWERNPLWIAQKELMARYRSATYFARMEMPEVLMGFHTDDEVQDMGELEKDVVPAVTTINTIVAKDMEYTEAVVDEKPKPKKVAEPKAEAKVVVTETETIYPSAEEAERDHPLITEEVPQANTIDNTVEVAEHAETPTPEQEVEEKPKRAVKAVTMHYAEMERIGIKRGHLAKIVRYFNLDATNIEKFMADKYNYMNEFYAHHTELQPNPETPLEESAELNQEPQPIAGGGTVVATSSTIKVDEQEAVVDATQPKAGYTIGSDVAVNYTGMMMGGLKRADLIKFCKHYDLNNDNITNFMLNIKAHVEQYYVDMAEEPQV